MARPTAMREQVERCMVLSSRCDGLVTTREMEGRSWGVPFKTHNTLCEMHWIAYKHKRGIFAA